LGEIAAEEARPELSVVVASAQPWPELRTALDSVYSQARAIGAELIAVDGDGHGLPEDHPYAGLRLIRRPGATVWQARAIGFAEARGEIVAMTEDHCRVAPDWCEQVLRAHRENPRVAAIGGVVDNGATASLWDWANFLVSNGGFLPPIPNGERPDICGQANISYKRWALPDRMPPHGFEQAEWKAKLRAAGFPLVNDDRLVVSHVQALGALGGCMIHYHDGRVTAALARMNSDRGLIARRIARGILMPLRVVRDSARLVARIVVRKPKYRRVAILSAPLIAVVISFHAAGELTGWISGRGDSPRHLR
jgi:hypothetical protein